MATCSYVFKKGATVGTCCSAPVVVPGAAFCKKHAMLRSNLKQADANPGAAVAVTPGDEDEDMMLDFPEPVMEQQLFKLPADLEKTAPEWTQAFGQAMLDSFGALLQKAVSGMSARMDSFEQKLTALATRVEEGEKNTEWCKTQVGRAASSFNTLKSDVEALQASMTPAAMQSHVTEALAAGPIMERLAKTEADVQQLKKDFDSRPRSPSGVRTYAGVLADAEAEGGNNNRRPSRPDSQTLQTFQVTGFKVDDNCSSAEVAGKLESLIAARLKDDKGKPVKVKLTDARRIGRAVEGKPRKLLMRVSTMWEAEAIVKYRTQLKGSGITILDELTEEEWAAKRQLWGQFKGARDAGKKCYFKRARLFIDGKQVV